LEWYDDLEINVSPEAAVYPLEKPDQSRIYWLSEEREAATVRTGEPLRIAGTR
jgi:hypothetical protein